MSSIKLESNASGTGIFTIASPNSNTNYTLTLPQATTTVVGTDATQTLTNKTIQGGAITSGTSVTASSTSVDFTGIPSWVKRITVMFSGVSTNGASNYLIQLGDSGGIETTGYTSAGGYIQNAAASAVSTSTAGFIFNSGASTNLFFGSATICLIGSNIWAAQGLMVAASVPFMMAGGKTLSDTLTQVRFTTVNGTDAFDAGTINILYEG